MHDRAPVADQLAGQLAADGGREELRGLHLLRDHERLGLGPAARLVVAREREEDDEPEQDGEAGREDPEDTRGAVTVGEVAPLGRAAAHEQHRRDRDGGHAGGDQEAPENVHRHTPALAAGPDGSASPGFEARLWLCAPGGVGRPALVGLGAQHDEDPDHDVAERGDLGRGAPCCPADAGA